MIELKNGEHTTYKSKNGTSYWVCNLNSVYYVETKHGSKRTATKEIRENIKLI